MLVKATQAFLENRLTAGDLLRLADHEPLDELTKSLNLIADWKCCDLTTCHCHPALNVRDQTRWELGVKSVCRFDEGLLEVAPIADIARVKAQIRDALAAVDPLQMQLITFLVDDQWRVRRTPFAELVYDALIDQYLIWDYIGSSRYVPDVPLFFPDRNPEPGAPPSAA